MTTEKFIPALGYDFLTEYYDLAIKITMPEKKFRNKLIDIVNPKVDEKILEFGFGTAQNIIILKQRFPKCDVLGVDIDPKVKSIAEYKLNKADCITFTANEFTGTLLAGSVTTNNS